MNELYLYVNEQQSLHKVLRSMVGLPNDATTHSLLAAMREALDLSDPHKRAAGEAAGPGGGKSGGGKSAPPAASQAEAKAEAKADGGDSQQPKTLPQYVAIAAELRKLVHAPTVLAIVPAIREMQAQLAQHKQSSLQMQAMIQELCATLQVGTAEAALAERIQAIAENPAAAEGSGGAAAGTDTAGVSPRSSRRSFFGRSSAKSPGKK